MHRVDVNGNGPGEEENFAGRVKPKQEKEDEAAAKQSKAPQILPPMSCHGICKRIEAHDLFPGTLCVGANSFMQPSSR